MNKRQKLALSEKYAKLSDNEVALLIRQSRDDFLYSPEWKALKRKAHEKYGFACMKCGFLPRDKRKSNVDHIKPRKLFPELTLCFDNLQVLCVKCNKEKGNKDMTDYRSTLG